MNIDQLTDNEVRSLLKSLRTCQSTISNAIPPIGRIKDDTLVLDSENNIEYTLHRYRHPLDSSRFSLHIRFIANNAHLIRIDINNGTHKNPDGTVISQNHMHLYHYQDVQRKDAFAYSLPAIINDISTLLIVLKTFLIYTNTKLYDETKNI